MSVTIGEALARRKLEHRETAAGNVKGYAAGQHKATRIAANDAILSYVDRAGAVCIVPVEKIEDDWVHRGVMVRATQHFAETRSLGRGVPLNDEQVRAIQAAFDKKAPAQPGQD